MTGANLKKTCVEHRRQTRYREKSPSERQRAPRALRALWALPAWDLTGLRARSTGSFYGLVLRARSTGSIRALHGVYGPYGRYGLYRLYGPYGPYGLYGYRKMERFERTQNLTKISQQTVKLARSERKATKNADSYGKQQMHPTIKKIFVNNPKGEISGLVITILHRILDALVFNNTKYPTL